MVPPKRDRYRVPARSGVPWSGRMGRSVKWLSPGLSVKRWLFLSLVGIILISLGLAIPG